MTWKGPIHQAREGELGRGAPSLRLARLAVSVDLEIEKPEWEYSVDLKAEIAAQLAVFDANADDRTGGQRMDATKARDAALALFETSLSRYRHYLCSASDDVDQSPELRRAGFKVRKDRTKPAKAPPASGGATATAKP